MGMAQYNENVRRDTQVFPATGLRLAVGFSIAATPRRHARTPPQSLTKRYIR
jgi:hypothetical protein